MRIAGTFSFGPGERVATADLVAQLAEPRDAAHVQARTGIAARYFAPADVTSAGLAAEGLRGALAAAGMPAEALARIIFVSSVGGDLRFPATANKVAAALGLDGSCDCFDLNNSCMGFLTALDLGARSVATGLGPVGIAVVEIGSRYVTPADPRPFLVFGDAVAAAVLDEAPAGEGIEAIYLANRGLAGGSVSLRHHDDTGYRDTIHFARPSAEIGDLALDAARRCTSTVLEQTGLTMDAVRWVVPHQPNGPLLGRLLGALGVPADRTVSIVEDFGSIGAASMAVGLDHLLRDERVRPGDRIMLVGVGEGVSYGAALLHADRNGGLSEEEP